MDMIQQCGRRAEQFLARRLRHVFSQYGHDLAQARGSVSMHCAANPGRRRLEIRLAGLPEESVLIALTRSDLARTLADQGQNEEALSLLRAAYPRLLAVRGEDHRDVRTAARYLERLGGD